ncbi:MAG: ATP-binding protein, partial [Verrucomicrobiota bacterium]
EDFTRGDFGFYFQIWGQNGIRILKSPNLGQFEIERPDEFATDYVYANQKLGNGDWVRTLAVESDGGALGPVGIMVAATRETSDASLRKLVSAIVVIGTLSGVGFAALASFALHSGLRPLKEVGTRAQQMDADTLSARFSSDSQPKELGGLVARLNELMRRLEESFARERRFSADLAHELRNPVAALRSIAEVALKWPDQASAEDYEDVLEITGELQTTIENMLTLVRLEKGSDQIRIEPVKVASVVDEIWPLFATTATERGVVVDNRLESDFELETDTKLFRVIVSNLLSNAAEYAPTDSEIVVETIEKTGFSIANPAPHLTEADLPRMFDRLWRHDQARTDSTHSGLGLALAKSCAEVLNVELIAQLKDDKQLHFIILPSGSAP